MDPDDKGQGRPTPPAVPLTADGISIDKSLRIRRLTPGTEPVNPRPLIPKPHLQPRSPWALAFVTISLLATVGAQAAPAIPTADTFSWAAFLGPFHMVVLHYPIGFLTLTALLAVWASWQRSDWARKAVRFVLPITAASAVLAAMLGWMRAGAGEFDPSLLNWHRATGLGIAACTVAAAGLQFSRPSRARADLVRLLYRGSLGLGFLLLIAAGHFGGSLTHGSGFLTRNAPPALRRALGETGPAATSIATTTGSGNQSLYLSLVKPALEKRCYACHGPDKQKGKLRLDRRENALAGGESGEPAIQPGDIRKSRILYHLLVPREHDDAMPPDGKEPMTAEQIVGIGRWIQQGAPFE